MTPVSVGEDEIRRLRNGQPIPGDAPDTKREGCALDSNGSVVAILRFEDEKNEWWPEKVFAGE